MDQWRERGFVPDSGSESEDEDEFDSLKGSKSRKTEGGGDDVETPNAKAASGETGNLGDGGNGPDDNNEDLRDDGKDESQVVPPISDVESLDLSYEKLENEKESGLNTEEEGIGGGNHDSQIIPDVFEPEPVDLDMEVLEEKEEGHDGAEADPLGTQAPQKSIRHISDAKSNTDPKANDRFWEPSSSPDELQFEAHITPKKTRQLPLINKPDDAPQSLRDVESESDSPLSSPSSSMESLLGKDPEAASELLHSVENMPPLCDIPEEILAAATARSGRDLRQRNPIQLYPYLLEDAKYRNLLKDRGYRPTRVSNKETHDTSKPTDESQGQSFEVGDNSQDLSQNVPPDTFQFPPSLPGDESRSRTSIAPPSIPPEPDIPAPIEQSEELATPTRPLSRSDSHSSKRRKLTTTYGKKNRTWISSTPTQKPQKHNEIPPAATNLRDSPSNVPPSPPISGDNSSSQTQPPEGFRVPPDVSYLPPNTPVTGPRPTPRDVAAVETVASSEHDTEPHEEPVPVYSSESEAAEPSDRDDIEVRRLRRKMHGVLPASWLRLDLKKQESSAKAAQKRLASSTLGRDESAKGVAKRIMRTRNSTTPSRSRDWRSAFPISDESDAEDVSPVIQEKSRDALADLMGFDMPLEGQGDIDGDIPEDNRIDAMFPSVPRQPKVSKPKKSVPALARKHQSREKPVDHLPPSKRSHRTYQTSLTGVVSRSRGTAKSTRTTKSTPKKPKPPRLGILDAPDLVNHPRQTQPQFMRIAARQARSRRDQGRGSPTRKFLRLGSKIDTANTNQSLYEWKSGNIRPNKTVDNAPKPKLRQRPARGQGLNQLYRMKTKSGNFTPEDPQDGLDTSSLQPPTDIPQEAPANDPIPRSTGRQEQGAFQILGERARQPTRPTQIGSKWVVKRRLGISSLKRNVTRPAQLESSKPVNRVPNNSNAFKKSLEVLNKAYNQPGQPEGYQLARFLADSTPQPAPQPEAGPAKPHRPRKRRPRRIDADAAEHRQTEIITVEDGAHSTQPAEDVEILALRGFSAGTPYPIDFDISPLPFGTFFRESTFIGSGEFSRSLNVLSRDLDKDWGVTPIQFGDRIFKWGQWNEAVSSELSLAVDTVLQDVYKVAGTPPGAVSITSIASSHLYRSIIRWITDTLSFGNPTDRSDFIGKCLELSYKLIDKSPIRNISTTPPTAQSQIPQLLLMCFNLIIANQVRQISLDEKVLPAQSTEAHDIVKNAARRLLSFVLSKNGIAEIRKFLEENKLHEKRDIGVGEGRPYVESYLAARAVLDSDIGFRGCFEDYATMGLLSAHSMQPEATSNVRTMEIIWHDVFTLLPLDEMDDIGTLQVGSRYTKAHENWKLVNRLLSRVLWFYPSNPPNQYSSFHRYCRALFHRCYCLINNWGWKNCKTVFDTLFDFFAKHEFGHLRNEQSYGSPYFLEKLDKSPVLEVEPRDCCFHIFLKIVGRGLQLMSSLYEKKKIRSFAWRLLPNHGRVYPKEQQLLQKDLDALKNHHDLLCTLYWATPDGYRPRLETIRDLVHPASSHIEACRISIRAWARLARFKLSTDEDIKELEAFADWHSYFTNEMLKQHAVARTEVEAQDNSVNLFSRQVLESAIAENQRQIESILNNALTSLKDSIDASKTMDHARVLLAKVPIIKLLGLFNSKTPRINSVVYHSLDVVLAYTRADGRVAATGAKIDTSEDSQDYGDWGVFEEVYDEHTDKSDPAIDLLDNIIRPSVSRLVSNCFGEDQSPDDKILLKVVDSWTSVVQVLVKHKRRSWSDYLNPYDGDSWASLRLTNQTRKFTAHFLASLVEKSPSFYTECKVAIMDIWASSLVERGTMLKFQHQLTNALLNADVENPLFQNLPFSVDRETKRYGITLAEFSDRRLSLISSLLSNMQHSLSAQGRSGSSRREEYKSIFEKLMTSMKTNYNELGNSEDTSHKLYVEFVHRIVGFLQQYAQGICPVDDFFTNPSSFPLPATDPTYIVAKLKSYGLRLSTPKVSTQLITFIQSVSERAAVDGQQIYLVDQLFTAMSDTPEKGDYQQPTLRLFLFYCVFPAYIEKAFETSAAWILAKPIVQAVGRVFRDLLLEIDVNSRDCLYAVVKMIEVLMEAVHHLTMQIMQEPKLLEKSFVLLILPSLVETVTSILPVIDYIERVSSDTSLMVKYVKTFRHFSLFVIEVLSGRLKRRCGDIMITADFVTDVMAMAPYRAPKAPKFFHEARAFANRELENCLKDGWSFHGGKYYVRRGNQPKEISVSTPEDNGKAALFTALEAFFGTLEGMEVFPRLIHNPGKKSVEKEPSRVLADEDFYI
ncbi:hypothetical protein FQN54_004147 [Arachnomyces sp. PD_36]|nr:hypothetical protein FQN54_004147 [Arachnomyces sp. PD_36]